MKLEKIRARLQKALAGDREELERLARDLGHELPRKRLETLDEFRYIIAPVERPADQYVKGFLDALCWVVIAYEAAIRPEIEEQEAAVFLRENGFEALMVALLDGPQPAEFFSDKTNSLNFLSTYFLDRAGDPPVYRLSPYGERVANRLKSGDK